MGKIPLGGAFVALCFVSLSTSAWAQEGPASSAPVETPADQTATTNTGQQPSDDELSESQRDELARAEFEVGRAAYEQGNFQLALTKFRHAHALSGRPQLLFNIGQSADRLRRDTEAIEAFEAFLEQVPDHPNRARAHRQLGALRAQEQANIAPENVEDPDVPRAVTPTIIAGSQEPLPPFEEEEEDSSIVESPVFWLVVGAVVVGGVIAAILLSTSGPEDPDGGTWNRHLVGLTWEGP